jgi:hypothetical protein
LKIKATEELQKSTYIACEIKQMFQYLFSVCLPFTKNCNTITGAYGGYGSYGNRK